MNTPQDVIHAYFERFEAGDAEGVGALFADDASLMPNGMDTVVGRAAITDTFRRIAELAEMTCQTLLFNRLQDFGDVVVVETATRERIRRRSQDESELGDFRELFCLSRSVDGWAISTYMGNVAARLST
jgi:ketosteroid isomerase-like protein